MILYRVINDDEYRELFKGMMGEESFNMFKSSSKNVNTFDYDRNIQYMHFFKFAEHARKYAHLFGNKLIMCDIPDGILKIGYGIYKYLGDKNILIPIPEYIINRDNFKTDYVVKVKPKKSDCIQLVDGMNKVILYHQLLDDLYDEFLNNGQSQFDNNKFIVYVLKYFNEIDIDDVILKYANSNKMMVRKKRK